MHFSTANDEKIIIFLLHTASQAHPFKITIIEVKQDNKVPGAIVNQKAREASSKIRKASHRVKPWIGEYSLHLRPFRPPKHGPGITNSI